MDAHLFRRFCDAYLPSLPGSRLEKIHQPATGVTVFTVYGMLRGTVKKHYLVLKAERKNPLLFASEHHVPVHAHPPAPIMRLRKYLSGQRIIDARCDWPNRVLYLETTGAERTWLKLDLREGPCLIFEGPPPIPEPAWPPIGPGECSPFHLLDGQGWRDWPVLTPALRRTLPFLDELDASALITDLEAGGGDVFLYETSKGMEPPARQVSAWPLPAAQLHLEDQMLVPQESVFEDALEALALAGETQVFAHISSRARAAVAKPFMAEDARLARLQKKLDQEEQRLQALAARQEDALLLQSHLYQFAADVKQASVTLNSGVGPKEIRLDPRLTIRENMEAMFHQAGRGKRGLVHLEKRKQAVAGERRQALDAMVRSQAAMNTPAKHGATGSPLPGSPSLANQRKSSTALPKQVQAFRSSDGFLILRGRDTKGNGMVLKLAAPYDFWLHIAHGPSAHVVIRRDHAGQDVPERTLAEAGVLAALKSHLGESDRAEIQYSLAKYIRPMKKAAPGMVRIDRSEGAFWVNMDKSLEETLKI